MEERLKSLLNVNVHFSADHLGKSIYRAFPESDKFSKSVILTLYSLI